MKIITIKFYMILLFIATVIFGCQKQKEIPVIPYEEGNVSVALFHHVLGKTLIPDSLIYRNSLGEYYMINDLQYFISKLQLHDEKGKWIVISSDKGIHYTDIKLKTTLEWKITDGLPAGSYDSLAFIFGLDTDENISFRFPDPPERDMFWPEMLGGGYHYMKMNMKWKNDTMPEQLPFMFHLGIGQMYQGSSTDPDSIIGFIPNYFKVTLPVLLKIGPGATGKIGIIMNIEKWFDGENAFDFARYPMGIMQNQEGMYNACMNGRKAFGIVKN